jgi:flavin-dependent dehydrogenase
LHPARGSGYNAQVTPSTAEGSPKDRYDLAITGGGLAGLSLGLQLKAELPDLSIFIAEKRKGPAPLAAFKVGESTVELSAFYFGDVLGLRDHLEAEQLPKAGLRYFWPAGDNRDITKRVEWGLTRLPPNPSFQLDRGVFENELATRNLAAGNDLFDDCRVGEVALSEDGADHRVSFDRGGESGSVSARWVIDASGPPGILKRKLGLEKDLEHTVNAAWLRLGGGIDVDEWSDDADWHSRMEEPGIRRLSTIHLMGEGFWVWLIPLSTGPHSIGIVADPRFHPFGEISTLDAAIEWLKKHEPQLGEEVDSRRDQVEDFHKIEDFAYSCTQVFSENRWALTGVAGVFADPFYSPGSDFIAQGNTFILEMVRRDLAGEDIAELVPLFNFAYLGLFEFAVASIYTNHYKEWGNAEVMCAKIVWEFAIYWAYSCLGFFHGKLTDGEFQQRAAPYVQRMIEMMIPLQQVFRDWHELSNREFRDVFIPNWKYPDIYQLHLDLSARFDDETLLRKHEENNDLLECVAIMIFAEAMKAVPDHELPEDVTIDPAKMSLDPARWEEDGLLGNGGRTLAQARARTKGFEQMLLGSIAKPV